MFSLNREVDPFLKQLGAFKVGVADPKKGFEKAVKGCHPRDLMNNCNSVIVFAFNIGLDYYASLKSHQDIRVGHLYRDWVGLQLINFLRKKGYDAVSVPRDFFNEKEKIAPLSFKLAAYEAGIGVFGRPSIIITPEFGPRANIGVVLSEAVLKPSPRMKDFNPCQNCKVCAKVCPVKAIDTRMPPPTGFNRQKCVQFVDWLKKETADKIKSCGYCYNRCPAGKLVKRTLEFGRWKALVDLKPGQRKKLVNEFTKTYTA